MSVDLLPFSTQSKLNYNDLNSLIAFQVRRQNPKVCFGPYVWRALDLTWLGCHSNVHSHSYKCFQYRCRFLGTGDRTKSKPKHILY